MAEDQVPGFAGDLVVRQSPWPPLTAAIVALAFAAGIPCAIALTASMGGAFGSVAPTLFHLLIAAIGALTALGATLACLVAGLAFLASASAALRPTNWALRAGPAGLYVKLRSPADHRLAHGDRIVLHIPKRAVRWLRTHDERARHLSRAGDFISAEDDSLAGQQYLEITLRDGDFAAVGEALQRERNLYGPTFVKGVTAKAKGAPVSVRPDGALRIDWKTRRTRLTPDLSAAMGRLAREYRIAPRHSTTQAQIRTLGRDAREERLLDLVDQGNVTDAVILARDIYGFDLTEAKAFLDDLQRA